jgi:hypothetical protein
MGEINIYRQYDPADLKRASIPATVSPKAKDAPEFRLTAPTFPANSSIIDWVLAGNLTTAMENYNKGGAYNTSTGECWPKDFWLMRIFDVMEDLGKAKFEKFYPGVWESILDLYVVTFADKIVQKG